MTTAALTAWERCVVGLIRDGLDTEEIAEELDVAPHKVKRTFRRIARKVAGGRMVRFPELPDLADQLSASGPVEMKVGEE